MQSITTLYLVRHGATASNEQRPYVLQGCTVDHPLSSAGEGQAAATARLLASLPIDAVYCSRLIRALQTAAAIAEPHGLTATPLDSLQEIDVGQWEGLSWNIIQERHPAAFAEFDAAPGTVPYLGGESYADVLRRVEPVFETLYHRHQGRPFVVVAHNVVNRAYLSRLLGLDINRAKSLPQANGGVNVIEQEPATGRVMLRSLNAMFHLPRE